jgi:hypothetical protein
MRATPLLFVLALGCSDYDLTHENEQNDPADTDEDTQVDDIPQPDIAVSPASLDFGWLPLECPADAQTVTVTNEGEADLYVDAIDLVGDGISAFALDGTVAVLKPGESGEFDVSFVPDAYMAYDVDVRIASNDPDEAEVAVEALGNGSEDAMLEELFEQGQPSKVDVLWVIDNSGSMSEEVGRLQDSFGVFMDEFIALGLDYQIGVTTTDMVAADQSGRLQGATKIITPSTPDPVATFKSNTALGSGGSADEKGLDAAKAALTDPLISAENAGLVRTDAVLAVVVLSDENDYSSISTSAFTSWLDAYKPDRADSSLSAIVGAASTSVFDPGGCMDMSTGVSAEGGDRYIDVANATGGMWGDICQLDFDLVLKYLSYNAAGLTQDFVLSQTPSTNGLGKIDVYVDGVEVPYHGVNGWTWLADINAVHFNGDTIPGPGASVVISYPVPATCN